MGTDVVLLLATHADVMSRVVGFSSRYTTPLGSRGAGWCLWPFFFTSALVHDLYISKGRHVKGHQCEIAKMSPPGVELRPSELQTSVLTATLRRRYLNELCAYMCTDVVLLLAKHADDMSRVVLAFSSRVHSER